MIEHEHQVVRVAIATRSLADVADACVVALECGVREPVLRPRCDAVEMPHQHLPELDERTESCPVERLAPAGNEPLHPALGRVRPRVLEVLLEHVGAEQSRGLHQQDGELAAASPVNAPMLLEQEPLLAATRGAIATAAPP